MKVLILGGGGMLGHKLWQTWRDRFDTWVTFRSGVDRYARYGLFDPERSVGGVNAMELDTVVRVLADVRPDVVLNCVGIIKQLAAAHDPIQSLSINSLFPHRLGNLCRAAGARLIHISTDCVFSGRKGSYTEQDVSDAEDLYGRTKFLGEVAAPGCLTLRTSIIGRELSTASGLVEWFLSNRGGQVRGFSEAIYTGLTTGALAAIIAEVIERFPDLDGLWQVSTDPIDKHALLEMIRDEMELDVRIEADPSIVIDRSLDSSLFRETCDVPIPTWQQMIRQLANDPTPYDEWRDAYVS